MKIKLSTTAIFFLTSLIISSCGSAGPATAPEQATAAAATLAPTEADAATATITPTAAPTATVYPPVFDPAAIGDNRALLDSFTLTRTDKTTSSGTVDETRTTIEYIKEPFTVSVVYKNIYSGADYSIGGVSYNRNPSGDLYIYVIASPYDTSYFQQLADMREFESRRLSDLLTSALFVDQVDFEGIPANHFTLDETNVNAETAGIYEISAAQGELYLAQDGNYLLYFHLKLTGSLYPSDSDLGFTPAVFEITEELSSINQAPEIAVPADFAFLDPELAGVPLPADLRLRTVIRYNDGRNYDMYFYNLPMSFDEFLGYYRDLAPTNGWSVVSIGVKDPLHYICDSEDCVVLKKGGQKIILYRYEGGIAADYYN